MQISRENERTKSKVCPFLKKIVRRNYNDVNVSSLLVTLVYKTAHWLQIYEHFRKRKSFPLWRCHSEWSKQHSNVLMINCVWDFEISLLLVSHCTKQFVENSGLRGETKKLLLLAIQQVQSKPQTKTSRGNKEQTTVKVERTTWHESSGRQTINTQQVIELVEKTEGTN